MRRLREGHRVGLEYLENVTALLQRVRSAHPTAGLYEAADLQWWWAVVEEHRVVSTTPTGTGHA